jgi:hypothetical protein
VTASAGSSPAPLAGSNSGAPALAAPPHPNTPAGATGPSTPPPPAQQRALAALGAIVAPAALVTALMYLFGLLHAYWFFNRFGVDYTLMGLTTEDYLVRSADGLFVPLVALSAAGLAVLWCGRRLPAFVRRRAGLVPARAVAVAAYVLAAALLVVAVVGIAAPGLFVGSVALPGLALTVAVLVLAAVSRPRRAEPGAVAVAEWIAIFLLTSTGLYWAVTDYSAAVGTARAEQLIAALPAWPDAIVYSEKSLNVALPGVHERQCGDAEGAYAYRYDGLKLVLESGGQLFLLPAQWADGTGTALVLPRTDAIRLEFTAPGRATAGAC